MRLVSHMETRGWDTWARDQARAIIEFFSNTARQHYTDIDKQVFPLVVGRGDQAIETNVDRLRQDHGWLEENWRELLAQLQPVAEGFSGYDTDTLRHAATVYTALLCDRMTLEKGSVYPAACASAEVQIQGEQVRLAESENYETSGHSSVN